MPSLLQARDRTLARQRGQALIELLIAAIVLLPLFWAVVMLGKYLSIQDSTINASRWLAFECTVRTSDCLSNPTELTDATRLWALHFSAADTAIQSRSGSGGPTSALNANPLWTDHRQRRLLSGASSVQSSITEDSFDAGESVALSGPGSVTSNTALMAQAGPERFGFSPRSGLLRFAVQARTESVGGSFVSSRGAQIGGGLSVPALTLSARSAILVDSWNASSSLGADPDSVESRVLQARDPVALAGDSDQPDYSAIRFWLRQLGSVGLEPAANQFEFRSLAVDVLPHDRSMRQP
jgi:hypothetical protein